MVNCFNEWMRRVVEEPLRFEREFEQIGAAVAAHFSGREPTYGEMSTAYMMQLAAEGSV
jgi:hypothetical protein